MILSQLIDPADLVALNGGQIRTIMVNVEMGMLAHAEVKKTLTNLAGASYKRVTAKTKPPQK